MRSGWITASLLLALVGACTPAPTTRPTGAAGTPTAHPDPTATLAESLIPKAPPERLRSWTKWGSLEVVDERRIATIDHAPDQRFDLTDLSSTDRYAAFVWSRPESVQVGVLDLTTGDVPVRHDLGPRDAPLRGGGHHSITHGGAFFSPDDSMLLYRYGRWLHVAELFEGSVRRVAPVLRRGGSYQWLHDGRIAYVDARKRIVTRRIGERAKPTGVRIEGQGQDHARFSRWSLDPSGRRLLAWDGCGTSLFDLETGRSRRLLRGYSAGSSSWSPSGDRFVLVSGDTEATTWFVRDCPDIEVAGTGCHDKVFNADGTPVMGSRKSLFGGALTGGHGHSLAWSKDGRWIFARQQPSGTCVSGGANLFAADTQERRRDQLLYGRMAGNAVGGHSGFFASVRYTTTLNSLCDSTPDNDNESLEIWTAVVEQQ
jgi:hypothetical protein